jgi:MSHA biogenesis protein MshG
VFKGFGAELPLMTRMLIGFSDFMVAWWPAMLLAGWSPPFSPSTPGAGHPRRALHLGPLKLRIPIAGKIIRKATLARFAASFALARAAACRSCRP